MNALIKQVAKKSNALNLKTMVWAYDYCPIMSSNITDDSLNIQKKIALADCKCDPHWRSKEGQEQQNFRFRERETN